MFTTSCSKDDKKTEAPKLPYKEQKVDASSYDKWVYFSFENGVVTSTTATPTTTDSTIRVGLLPRWGPGACSPT